MISFIHSSVDSQIVIKQYSQSNGKRYYELENVSQKDILHNKSFYTYRTFTHKFLEQQTLGFNNSWKMAKFLNPQRAIQTLSIILLDLSTKTFFKCTLATGFASRFFGWLVGWFLVSITPVSPLASQYVLCIKARAGHGKF